MHVYGIFSQTAMFPFRNTTKIDLKLGTEKGINENSWLWKFQIFLLFLSWNKNIESANIYELYKRHAFTIPVSYDRNNEKIWNFYNQLFALMSFSLQSFNSQVCVSEVPEGKHSILIKNTLKWNISIVISYTPELFSEYL